MLNHISTIWKYRNFLTIHKSHLDVSQLKLLKSIYRPTLSKLRKLDISLASDILFPLYSHIGRRAINLAVLVRSFVLSSFVLMNHLKYSSIKLWCDDFANDSCFNISLALLIRLILLRTMTLSFALLATILIYRTLLINLSLLRKNLRISLPKVKNLLSLPKMTLLLFAINTETVQSSTEIACYTPCNLFLTLLQLFLLLLWA